MLMQFWKRAALTEVPSAVAKPQRTVAWSCSTRRPLVLSSGYPDAVSKEAPGRGAAYTVLIGIFGWLLFRGPEAKLAGSAVLLALLLQLALGSGIVLFGVPLGLAVAHNGVAALLLLTVINAHQRIWQH